MVRWEWEQITRIPGYKMDLKMHRRSTWCPTQPTTRSNCEVGPNFTFTWPGTEPTLTINVADLAEGSYVLRGNDGGAQKWARMVMVAH